MPRKSEARSELELIINNCGRRSLNPKLVRSVLIHGRHSFADGARAARRREKRASKLDELYENAWHSVAKPPRRRSGIISERYFSMRAPSVVPRYAVAVGSLKECRGGTAIGKTLEERGNFI